jgi:glc operon protein GlcG
MAASSAELLVAEVARLFPSYLEDPVNRTNSGGCGALVVIDADGALRGRLFGEDKTRMRRYHGIASRKAAQVWCTGYATERFEQLVFSGALDEKQFGLERPDFIGWKGGVPLQAPDGRLIAAAFSGFPGIKDVEIIERAAAAVPGLAVRRG